ncbi:MAG: DUF2993 domain-containing protein [Acidimicrobiia bacterium]|nr:DUF2993 domain-containing protein [Acidimicrobiia bacterium]
MRLLLRVVVVLVVLGGMLLLATELLAKPFAERAVGRQIRDERGLASTPDVELSGFPFALAVARGQLDAASVSIDQYVVDGLLLRHATLDLDEVDFSVGSLVNGDAEVEAASATIVADVTDADLNSWLAARAVPLTVRFAAGQVHVAGRLELEGVGGDVQAVGTVAVEGGALSFAPAEVLLGGVPVPGELVDAARGAVAFTVPLPEVAGAQVTGATIGEGAATLTASVADYLLTGDSA